MFNNWYRNKCVLCQNNEEILSVLSFRTIIWHMLGIRANESDFFFLSRIGNVYCCLWTLDNIKTLHPSVLLDLTFIKSVICPHRLFACVRTTLQEQRCSHCNIDRLACLIRNTMFSVRYELKCFMYNVHYFQSSKS